MSQTIYCPAGLLDIENRSGDFIPGIWRNHSSANSVLPLHVPSTGHNASKDAKRVRETFKECFFNSHLFCCLYDNGSLYICDHQVGYSVEVVLNLVYLSIFSGLAALMSADIARNL